MKRAVVTVILTFVLIGSILAGLLILALKTGSLLVLAFVFGLTIGLVIGGVAFVIDLWRSRKRRDSNVQLAPEDRQFLQDLEVGITKLVDRIGNNVNARS